MSYTSESQVSVRYAETDRMGVVYHANYLVWMEVGRTDFLSQLGFPYSRLEQEGVLFPTSGCSLRIIHPTRYEERLLVRTVLETVQSRKVAFRYEISRENRVVVAGQTTHICVGPDMRVRTLPRPLHAALKQALNEKK
ncbi:MAG: acyl-CoA thioesterase [Candidatus Glassbacteria bacterium]|nr:acyl-CoA thioesterase [Candidatus Glassbacteria bacterium]